MTATRKERDRAAAAFFAAHAPASALDADKPAPLVRMKEARRAAGLSQAAAGQLIGKTQSHFAKIERGEVALSAADALTLCKALALDLDTLLSVTS